MGKYQFYVATKNPLLLILQLDYIIASLLFNFTLKSKTIFIFVFLALPHTFYGETGRWKYNRKASAT